MDSSRITALNRLELIRQREEELSRSKADYNAGRSQGAIDRQNSLKPASFTAYSNPDYEAGYWEGYAQDSHPSKIL